MFWNKKDKNNPENPQFSGKNYKFKHIKFYAHAESMFANQRHYRKIMEQDEVTYLNWEVAIYNKKFDELDWKASIVTKCYKIDENKNQLGFIPREFSFIISPEIDINETQYKISAFKLKKSVPFLRSFI